MKKYKNVFLVLEIEEYEKLFKSIFKNISDDETAEL
jgi:hypothetical protein